jgi:hypothetical protein
MGQNRRGEIRARGGNEMSKDGRSFAPGAQGIVGMVAGFVFAAILFVGGTALAAHRARSVAENGGQMGRAASPSDAQHALLMKLAGEYDRAIKFVGQTGAMAAPSSGTCKISAVLGGRFILEESHDTVFGRPVDGLRIYGYDDATKQFEMARMYTMSNGITLMKGTSSDGGNTIEFAGEGGTGSMVMHAQMKQIDADRFSVVLSTVGADGKETPFQETDYTRKK